jgi:hypothetical protein
MMIRLALFTAALTACARGPKTPEEAQAVVQAGDPKAVYDAVDLATRWSIDATFKYHQQALASIEESYPADVQGREKARFIDGDDARGFLAAYDARYHVIAAGKKAPSDFIEEKGRWHWSGMHAAWDDIKQRASHDLETVRESAAAYKRASR